jgi:hypothetical protein
VRLNGLLQGYTLELGYNVIKGTQNIKLDSNLQIVSHMKHAGGLEDTHWMLCDEFKEYTISY